MSFTTADFERWRFDRDAVHFNGGRVFFGWGHRCIDQPRLLVIDKYFKKDRSTVRSYTVDCKTQCATLEGALAALSVPPAPNEEELALLRALPEGWSVPDRRVPLMMLAEMGLIEWGRNDDDRVTCRVTDAARALIADKRGGE